MGEATEADVSALPAADRVLSALGTGMWHWDAATGAITMDAEAARLVGLPAQPVVLSSPGIRARFHPEDWNEVDGIVGLAAAEGTLAEARMRVVDDRGQEIRIVRTRCKPILYRETGGYELVGTFQEVTEESVGHSAPARVTGDWRRSRDAFLLEAGRGLAEARSTAQVLRVAAELSMPGFSPAGLVVFGAQGDRITIIGQHGYDPDDVGPFAGMPLDTEHPATEVIRDGRAVYISSREEYRDRYPETWALAERFHRRSWAFLPLTKGGRTMGAWLAAFADPVRFAPDERAILTAVARMLAQALFRAGVAESEKELAASLQHSMLPSLGPRIPGLGVAGRYVPTGGGLQVGGDWYDVITLPSGRIALVIGDVQGHDVRAAGLMGQLRIALRAYASEGHSPDTVLSRASRFVAGIMDATSQGSSRGRGRLEPADDRFATCLYVDADPETGMLEIARAGHLDPAVRTADGTVLMRPTSGGLPLGIDPDSDYPTTRVVLEPGETMLICTDGLIETGGHDLATGWKRVRNTLEKHGAKGLEVLADALVSTVHGPASQHTRGPLADRREDDIAVLLLRRTGMPAPRKDIRRAEFGIAQAEPERIADARRQLRELLHDWPSDEQVDSAELLVSELLANVLTHTDGDAWLVAEITGASGSRCMRVEVSDSSNDLPHKRQPGELASSGRGLVLIAYLADAWGVTPRGQGKSIWFQLQEPEPGGPGGVVTSSERSAPA
jgi:serine phosphatase RsbU (regulator of sigma subunit)/anti-sigma regulatory factor (Ser/Thr protein kinase)